MTVIINGTTGITTPGLTNDGSQTITGGTANGVAYLNGSKVLTTGSALTFDGVGTFQVNNGTSASKITSRSDISAMTVASSTYPIWYNTESNQPHVFYVNNTEQMRLTSTGLGIGTSSPSRPLSVSSSAYNLVSFVSSGAETNILIQNTSTGGRNWSIVAGGSGGAFAGGNFGIYDTTASAARLTLDSSGNLGLGVTPKSWTAGKAFEVGASGSALWGVGPGDTRVTANTYFDGIYRYAGSSTAMMFEASGGSYKWYTAPSGTAGNAISFTQAMTLDASGVLSVNITGSNSRIANFATSTFPARGLRINTFTSSNGGVDCGVEFDSGVGGYGGFKFSNSGTAAMTLDGSGNLGIGTSSPRGCLDVQGTAGGPATRNWAYITAGNVGAINPSAALDAGIAIGRNFSNGNSETNLVWGQTIGAAQYLSISKWNGSAVTEQMRIDSSGNLLVGATATTVGEKVRIVGSDNVLVSQCGNGYHAIVTTNTSGTAAYSAAIFCNNGTTYTSAGQITVSGSTTTYATSSDYRLKENVQPMQNALSTVAQLNPVTYTWKSDGSDGQGFIAHELQAVVPDCVTGEKDAVDEDGNPVYQGIDTSFLVATLTKAIQELTARIEQLEAK